ncbi:MAG TPA: M14 family zinc carboxypeptidase [Clostridia bacterium]|nr:M14 family zinc carboxypeptidase [Clostridia bacterium]
MKRTIASVLLAAIFFLSVGCGAKQETDNKEQSMGQQDTPAAVTASPSPTIEPTPVPTPTPKPDYILDSLFTVVCEDYVNMRAEPSSQAELVAEVKSGERVQVISYAERYAEVKALSTEQTGYVIGGYLKPEEDVLGFTSVTAPFGGTDAVPFNYTYEQMQTDIEKLAAAYSDKMTVESAGQSVEKRELSVLVLGDVNAKHHVFVQGAIHAREHMTALLCMALAEKWLNDGLPYPDVCIHILPMSNPDGVTLNQTLKFNKTVQAIYFNDGATGRSTLTGDLYLAEWKANINGVDLNRNFDAMWDRVKTCPAPSLSDYRGGSIESEPESKALVEYTKKYDFDATVSYHATGSMIYWEFGPNSPVNEASLSLAEAVAAVSAYKLEDDDGSSFGGYKDWASYKMNIPSLTIEIGTRAAPLPENEFYTIWLRNRNVLTAVAKWVMENGD